MGDYADDALARFWNGWGFSSKVKRQRNPTIVICRNCGEKNLRWGNKAGGGWVLRDTKGKDHICGPRMPTWIKSKE